MVRDALVGCREQDVSDTAELLTSELVTNALLHAGTELTVHVENSSGDGPIRIAIEDGSEQAPWLESSCPEFPETGDLCGRGLPLVAALATRWGWDPMPLGKRVWFEV